MSILVKEWKGLKMEVKQDYYNSLNELEKHKHKEVSSAVKIQRNVKMFLCRKRFKLLKDIALEIQKNFYGFLDRERYNDLKKGQSDDMINKYFEYHAIIIQKHWVGYRCRRNKLDYHERRKYLQRIKLQNEETLLKLQEYAKTVQYDLERKKEEENRSQFNNIAANLHHLVSTRTIPGVYNPPNVLEELKPQVYNADIETHIKSIFKSNFRKSSHNKKSLGNLSPIRHKK